MPVSLDHIGAPSSLTQRRPAASNLPNFELPAPQYGPQYSQQKYNLPQLNATQGTTVGGGNLLTPPSTVPGDTLSPLSSIISNTNPIQGLPSTYNYSWPNLSTSTGLTPLMGTASGNTPQPWTSSLNHVKGLFSPSLASTFPRGESNSPTAGEPLPPPPYDLNPLPPPLPTAGSVSTPSSLPAMAAQNQVSMQAFMAQQNQAQTQTPSSATTTQPSPVGGTETFSQRPQSTPSAFYSQSQPSSAQQATFPSFNSQSSPIQQTPMSAPPQGSRISPLGSQSATFSSPPPQSSTYSRSYGQYLPALSAPAPMNGPVMSNVHNPGNPMGFVHMPSHGLPSGLIPGYNSGHAAQIQHQMFGGQPQTPHTDRPFKCDQCPQSFNRNHDLKRHKRIHLAVKPFPCGHCEKSFSRKDALKGCGKGSSANKNEEDDTPEVNPKSEDSDDDSSPTLADNPS
ncbi:hypothetical protein ACLMJK_001020 [Lecanora helva]